MSEFLSGCIKQTEACNKINLNKKMKEELIKLFEKYEDINMASASARQMLATNVLELVHELVNKSFSDDYKSQQKQQELPF